MKKIIKKYPFTTWWLVSAVLSRVVYLIVYIFNMNYDDSILAFLLFLGAPIYGFPFWIISEMLFSFGGRQSFVGKGILTIIISFVGWFSIDILFFSKKNSEVK